MTGPSTPRMLDVAWAWLPAAGQRLGPRLLDAFFDGYQARREPTWGEWWALQQVLGHKFKRPRHYPVPKTGSRPGPLNA